MYRGCRACNRLTVPMFPHANATYCAPQGGANTYRPMFVPKDVGFLRPPRRIVPFTNYTRLVPILRMEDNTPIHFLYYGQGCSDTYIRVNASNGLVVHDRIDAVRQLSRFDSIKLLKSYCEHAVERAAVHLLAPMLLNHKVYGDMTAIRGAVTGSGCLNEWVYRLMQMKGYDTLILNFEAPGDSTDGTMLSRKTEIIYTGNEFYDATGEPCTLETYRGCYFCRGSIYSRATCHGKLRLVFTPPPPPPRPPLVPPVLGLLGTLLSPFSAT